MTPEGGERAATQTQGDRDVTGEQQQSAAGDGDRAGVRAPAHARVGGGRGGQVTHRLRGAQETAVLGARARAARTEDRAGPEDERLRVQAERDREQARAARAPRRGGEGPALRARAAARGVERGLERAALRVGAGFGHAAARDVRGAESGGGARTRAGGAAGREDGGERVTQRHGDGEHGSKEAHRAAGAPGREARAGIEKERGRAVERNRQPEEAAGPGAGRQRQPSACARRESAAALAREGAQSPAGLFKR